MQTFCGFPKTRAQALELEALSLIWNLWVIFYHKCHIFNIPGLRCSTSPVCVKELPLCNMLASLCGLHTCFTSPFRCHCRLHLLSTTDEFMSPKEAMLWHLYLFFIPSVYFGDCGGHSLILFYSTWYCQHQTCGLLFRRSSVHTCIPLGE